MIDMATEPSRAKARPIVSDYIDSAREPVNRSYRCVLRRTSTRRQTLRPPADTPAQAAAGPTRTARIEGLDIWRALLPALGILVHVNGLFLSHHRLGPGLNLVNIVVHSFRMEAFFVVAGLLASGRLSRSAYLKDRSRTLLVPLATLWTMVALWQPSRITGLIGAETSHLWFLLCLLQLSVLGIVGERLGLWDRLASAIRDDWRRAAALFFVVAGVLAAGFQSAFRFEWAQFSIAFSPVQSLYYSAYFGGGIVLGRSPAVLRSLRHPAAAMAALIALGALAALTVLRPDLTAGQGRPGVATFVMTAAALCCSAAIIGSSLHLHAGPAWRWLASASYSVYLLHFPLVMLVYGRTEGLAAGPRWALMLVLVTAGSLAGHAIIERSALLRSLLNGASWGWLDPGPARRLGRGQDVIQAG